MDPPTDLPTEGLVHQGHPSASRLSVLFQRSDADLRRGRSESQTLVFPGPRHQVRVWTPSLTSVTLRSPFWCEGASSCRKNPR